MTFSSKPSERPVAWRSRGSVTVRQISMLGSAAAFVIPRSVMDKGCMESVKVSALQCTQHACMSSELGCVPCKMWQNAQKCSKICWIIPFLHTRLCRSAAQGRSLWSGSAHNHAHSHCLLLQFLVNTAGWFLHRAFPVRRMADLRVDYAGADFYAFQAQL